MSINFSDNLLLELPGFIQHKCLYVLLLTFSRQASNFLPCSGCFTDPQFWYLTSQEWDSIISHISGAFTNSSNKSSWFWLKFSSLCTEIAHRKKHTFSFCALSTFRSLYFLTFARVKKLNQFHQSLFLHKYLYLYLSKECASLVFVTETVNFQRHCVLAC